MREIRWPLLAAYLASTVLALFVATYLITHHLPANAAKVAVPEVLQAPVAEPHKSPSATPERSLPLTLDIVETKTQKHITFGELMDRLNAADVVCVGEKHDSKPAHTVQLQIIKGLFAQDERIGVGMEMFQKLFQSAFDDYIAGRTTEEQFLKASEYAKRWGFDWALYRPIVEYCRRNHLPLAALNVRSELVKRLYKVGFAGLTEEEKKELGPIDFQVKAHRDYWYERLTQMHGMPNATPEQKERSYGIMTAWDDYMAQNASSFKKERKLQRLVILAGSGHINGGFGIPDRTAKYSGSNCSVATVAISNAGDEEADEESDSTLKADYVIQVR